MSLERIILFPFKVHHMMMIIIKETKSA